MAKSKRRNIQNSVKKASPFVNYWTTKNFVLLFAGLAVVLLGFILMAQGPWDNPLSLTVSPLVLLVAYLVIIPAAILFSGKKQKEEDV